MKVPAPYLASSGIASDTGRRTTLSYSLEGWQLRLPAQPLLAGPPSFLQPLAGIEQFLKVLSYEVALFFIPWLESRFLLGLFNVCSFWNSWVASFLSSKSGIYLAKNKKQTQDSTHRHVFPHMPMSLTSLPCSLHLSESYVCFICNFPGFCHTSLQKQREVYLFHLPKRRSPGFRLFLTSKS